MNAEKQYQEADDPHDVQRTKNYPDSIQCRDRSMLRHEPSTSPANPMPGSAETDLRGAFGMVQLLVLHRRPLISLSPVGS